MLTVPFGVFLLVLVFREVFAKKAPEYDWDNILEEAPVSAREEVKLITDIDPDNPFVPSAHTSSVAIGQVPVVQVPESEVFVPDEVKKEEDEVVVPMSTSEKLRKLAEEKDRAIRSGVNPGQRAIAS